MAIPITKKIPSLLKSIIAIALILLLLHTSTETAYAQGHASILNDDYGVAAALLAQITAVVVYLIGGFLGIRVFYAIFTGQIDLATGKPGALADTVLQIIFSIVLMTIASGGQEIGQSIGSYVTQNSGALTSASGMIDLISIIVIKPILSIAGTLALSVTIVAVVVAALKGQIGVLVGDGSSLANSWILAVGAVLLFAVGITMLTSAVRLIQ